MSGEISVVVVNYNGAAYLARCLGAVRALRGPVDEVIVVDNASTDESRALVARDFPEVRVIALAANEGPSPARNAGMRAAKHRWVLALDNDAVVEPDVLEKLLAARRAGVVLVQPRSVFDAEPARVHYDGGAFHYAGLIVLRNFYTPLASAEGSGVREVDCAVSVALLVDRETVLALGGYDARYFILFEDLDLSYRLRARGHAIVSVPDALVRHLGGTPGISFRDGPSYPASRVFLHARNRWMFLARNYQARTLLVHAARLEGQGFDEDQLAFLRDENQYLNLTLAELPSRKSSAHSPGGDFADTMLRSFLLATWFRQVWERLAASSSDAELAAIAAKALKEARYHQQHSGDWVVRLGDGTEESARRLSAAMERAWPYTAEMFVRDAVDAAAEASKLGPARDTLAADWQRDVAAVFADANLALPPATPFVSTGTRGVHSEHLGFVLAEMQWLQRAHPGGRW